VIWPPKPVVRQMRRSPPPTERSRTSKAAGNPMCRPPAGTEADQPRSAWTERSVARFVAPITVKLIERKPVYLRY
jgi:hypothetical protein